MKYSWKGRKTQIKKKKKKKKGPFIRDKDPFLPRWFYGWIHFELRSICTLFDLNIETHLTLTVLTEEVNLTICRCVLIQLNDLQTEQTQIRCRRMRHLIWVCTVCQLPFYGSPDYNGSIIIFSHLFELIPPLLSAEELLRRSIWWLFLCIFSYFCMKIYVVVLIRSTTPRCF